VARTSASTSSTSKRPQGPSVLVGRITAAHGLKGELRLESFAEGPETLHGVTHVRVEGERPDAPDLVLELRGLTPGRSGSLRLRLAGVDTRDAAEALRGRRVRVDAAQLQPLAPGELYGHELVGCALESEQGNPIGVVRDVWRTGAPDVLVVEDGAGHERLIPAALLREVDVAAGRAVVELLPGLLDPEEAV
jgi:16S rRNA processing protein RimM